MYTVSHETVPTGGRFFGTCKPRSLPPHGKDPYCIVKLTHENGETIGSVYLCKTKWGFWETHSEMWDESFRNQGYGIKMYSAAIRYARKRGWRVRSSLDYSEYAERVWCSRRLRKKHKIRKRGKRYCVESA